MRGASDEVLDRVLGGLLGALVEEQDGFTLFDGAEGVGGVLLAVETRGGHDAVVRLGVLQGHRNAGALEFIGLLGHVPRVKHQDAAVRRLARQQCVVLDVVEQAHDGDAAAVQGIIDEALLPDVDRLAREVLARERQVRRAAEAVEPVREEHHRHAARARAPRFALLAVAVEAVEHDIADDLRRDLLALKEIADCIEHRRRTAVILRELIAQRALHRFYSLLSKNACVQRSEPR